MIEQRKWKGTRVLSYNENKNDGSFYVMLPSEIKYNFTFLNDITELMKKIKESDSDKIYFSCRGEENNIENMVVSYLRNALDYLLNEKTIFVNHKLLNIINSQTSVNPINKFEKIDMFEVITADKLNRYCLHDEKSVNETVEMVVDFITEKNLMISDVKEFLITTIGEIFSNAFNHSDENSVYFMYDIECNVGKYYLVVNITDFGKNIISNVQEYQKNNKGKILNSVDCIKWAVQEGNTTRKGSGGYGLSTLIDYVSKVNGELLIFSGEGIYALKGKNINILQAKGAFYGASVSMKIPVLDTTQFISYDKEHNEIVSISLEDL